MKYMGIDYGSKRVGIAVSDEGGIIAFPRETLQNSQTLIGEVLDIIVTEKIDEIVVGKSVNQEGIRNDIMDDIDAFAEELGKLSGKQVHLQDERFTSHFLRGFDFSKSIEKPTTRNRSAKLFSGDTDAQAAAAILQRFLDIQQI